MLYTNDRELVATWDRKYLENMYVRAAMAFIEEREARDATRIRVVDPDVEPVIEAAVEAMAETPLMHSADVIANYEIAIDLVVQRARHVVAAFGSKSKRARSVRVARARELRLALEALDAAQVHLDKIEES